jgi:hypothetical protein
MSDERAIAYGKWLVQNKDKAGSPEFDTVATAYKQLRSAPVDAPAPMAEAAPGPAPMKGNADNWSGAEELGQGATLGAGIPITSALSVPLEMLSKGIASPVDAYKSVRDRKDADRAAWLAAHPVGGTAANVVGGLATGGGLAQQGVTMAGRLGTGVGARIGEAALEGAAYGGVQAGNEARGDISSQIGDAAMGAGIGGAAGGVLAGGAQALGALGSNVASAARGRLDPEGFAARKMAQRLEADGVTPSDLASRLQGAEPGTNIADVAGENTRDLLRTATNIPGRARQEVADMVESRMGGQRDRIMDTVSKKLAPGELYNASLDDIQNTYRAGADPLYKKAYSKPVNYDDFKLDELIPRIPKAAWSEANSLMGIEGYSPKQLLANIADDGSVSINKVPDMKQWDYVKRALDSRIAQEDGKGAIGGTTPMGRALTGLKTELVNILKEQNPAYKSALNFSSDQIGLKKALEMGPKLLSMAPDDAARAFSKLSMAEKETARIGVARAIRDKVLAGSDSAGGAGGDRVRAVWTEKTRQVIGKLFPGQKVEDFSKFMANEAAKVKTVRAASGNSTTARQLAGADEAGVDPELLLRIGRGDVVGATLSAISKAARKLGGLNDKSAGAMGDMLLSTGNDDTLRALQAARDAISRGQNRSLGVNPVLPRSVGLLSGTFAGNRDQ